VPATFPLSLAGQTLVMDFSLSPLIGCDDDRKRSLRLGAVLAIAIGLSAFGLSAARAAEGPAPGSRAVDFNRDIRPILSENCFACHGLDETKRKAGLRLDVRDAATQTTESGEVPIVPGKPGESELIRRVFAEDADQIMPPRASHKTLNAHQKGVLRRWIAEGAEYKVHWAFLRPERPALPAVRDRSWVRNEIDAFVLARLEQAGLKPSPEADRTTLIRRLSLDLIGLPPTLAEVDAFLADSDPGAYEKVVDRLLASPHYGERWARRWLDRARYADTNGYEKDRERSIWPYRDWVINALNADMPFDQFTIEQIAGDLLPGATESQKVATGFHRNTMINEEGGIDVEEFRFASLVDRVATTGTVWLGLTLQCAQCHTHKYDPITQREYYQFLAFFNNADEPELELPRPDIQAKRAEIEAKIAALEAELERQLPARDPATGWVVLEPVSFTSAEGATLTKQADDSVLASGTVPESDTYTVVADTRLSEIAEIRLEALTDRSLPGTGPGRAPSGSFLLSDFRVTAAPLSETGKPLPVEFDWIKQDDSVVESGARGAIDSDPKTGWGSAGSSSPRNEDRAVIIGLKDKVGFENGTRLTFTLKQKHGEKQTLGRFRLGARPPAAAPSEAERSQHLAATLAAFEAKANPVRWTVLTPSRVVSKKHATMTVLGDRSVLAIGDKPNTDTYVVELPTDLKGITALRLEVLPDASLPDGGPGRAPLFSVGDFILTNIEVAAAPASDPNAARPVLLQDASQDYSEPRRPAALAIDDHPDTGWTVKGRIGQPHAAVFTFKDDVGDGQETKLIVTLHQDGIHQMTIGRFRVSVTCEARPVRASGLPTDVEEILLIPAAQRTEAQAGRVKQHYLSIAPELYRQNEAIAALRRSMPKYPTTMVMREREPAHVRTTHIHKRGEFLQPTEPVTAAVPSVLHPLPAGVPRDRLSLARWLVAADNPLVGRVAMNQAWQAFFGRGLVGTVENFGTRGDEPTHPALLDWLATEFPRRGWSMKAMHRLIVTSATYRQSSVTTEELLARDPKNELLARGPRFRVDAEFVRDIALSASGLLNPEIGGPSVYPPQPSGVTELAYGQVGWPTSKGSARYRRGLYTFIKRTAPYAAFTTFDAPSSETTCVRRERSNTPLQALTLLNDAVFVEASRALAQRVLTQAPASFEERARLAFRLCLSRPPRDQEQRMLAEFYNRQLHRFQCGEADAGKVAGTDATQAGSVDPSELAAWTTVARILLNLDETVTKE
jgi:Protein of unknown function (DUF1553)/Protein of unknown function (DUF1549)/Planctomycete cytochrome C